MAGFCCAVAGRAFVNGSAPTQPYRTFQTTYLDPSKMNAQSHQKTMQEKVKGTILPRSLFSQNSLRKIQKGRLKTETQSCFQTTS